MQIETLNKHYDVVVVGGGISGLTAAFYLAKSNKRVLIVEKSRCGGALSTYRFKNLRAESGAHTAYNSYTEFLNLLAELEVPIEKKRALPFRFYKQGRLVKTLLQINFLELICSLLTSCKISKEGRSIKEYFSALLGERNYNNFFQHAFSAVLSMNADNFAATRIFKKRGRDKNYPRKFIVNKGFSTLVEKVLEHPLIDHLMDEGIAIETGQKLSLILSNRQKVTARNIILASPISCLSQILPPHFQELKESAKKIVVNEIHSITVTVSKDALNFPLSTAVIGIDTFFYSIVTADPFGPHPMRAFTFHLKMKLTQEEALDRIVFCLGISRADILDIGFHTFSLPILKSDHHNFLEELSEYQGRDGIYFTGNYLSGLAIEECVRESKRVIAQLVNDNFRKNCY